MTGFAQTQKIASHIFLFFSGKMEISRRQVAIEKNMSKHPLYTQREKKTEKILFFKSQAKKNRFSVFLRETQSTQLSNVLASVRFKLSGKKNEEKRAHTHISFLHDKK